MKNWLYILLIPFLFFGCNKEENSVIPLVTVNININTNDPAYNSIAVPGGWIYINGGSRGIIIYRVSNDAFNAYDRHCTYDSGNSCALVSVDATNTEVQGDEDTSRELGKLIGAAVQAEIVNQQRPGGLLSPA